MPSRDASKLLAVFHVGREASRTYTQARCLELISEIPGLASLELLDGPSHQTNSVLLTCWDGPEALRAHRDGAHGELTALPAFVMASGAGDADLQSSPPAVARLLSSHLASSESICVVSANASGDIASCNDAFCRLVGFERTALQGVTLWSLLVDTDAEVLRDLTRSSEASPAWLRLNFVDAASVPHTLSCTVDVGRAGLSLVGERNARREADFEQEVLRLNNELAVISRENARKSKELERAMRKLREAQALLIHTEKMASLGQMTAGVAHEINNPLAFVASNHATLKRDFDGLMRLINVVGDGLGEIGERIPHLHRTIVETVQSIRLNHLAESIPRKLSSNAEGLERIKQLVLDLRTSTRLDEAERKTVDLGESLRATLRFLEPLRSEHGVHLELELSSMPPTTCLPGALNQAVSNVVANAIQATQAGGVVRVQTFVDGDWHAVRVLDEGVGIPSEDQRRIFDPFFTTKPVGEGTGLGLNIAHQVVQAHGGRIDVESEAGCGTTVTIRVPGAGGD
jgi:two-component system NtrC family sensor kinase